MSVAPSIARRVAGLLLNPFETNPRRRSRAKVRFQLEGLEDRCLLSITEFPLPNTVGGGPASIATGPDGNLWFGMGYNDGHIGMINPTTDAITVFSLLYNNSNSNGVAAGPDGNIWFTDVVNNKIGEINPTTHAVSEFDIPTPNSDPSGITAGPDGNLWFTEYAEFGAGKIGLINPTTHAISEFDIPTTHSEPGSITAGPDGNLWFTEGGANNIGEINPTTHVITEFPAAGFGGSGITTGPDGDLWFTGGGGSVGDLVGTIDPATHAITTFKIPTAGSEPEGITVGSDGNLWFSEYGRTQAGKIGMINPTTDAITEYPIPYAYPALGGITTGPDGNIWFSDGGDDAIGVDTLSADHFVLTQQPPTSTTAGSPFGLTVEAEDSSGNLDSSLNGTVTVALANNPTGATLGGTLTVTASGGVATFSGLSMDTAAAGYTLLVSASGVPSVTTSGITITPAPASQVVITQQPLASVIVNSGFGLQATIEDPYGNLETSDSAAVAVALANNPDGANLGGTLSVTADNGVATFAGLTLDQLGSGYTLAVSSNGLSGETSDAITVIPVPAQLLVITQQPPANIVAGDSFSLIVQAEDNAGVLASSFNGTVTVALANNPTRATLGGTLSVTASGGTATFSDLSLTQAASGLTLLVSASGVDDATTSAINVTPAPASQLVITQQPPASVIVSDGFGLQATIEDPYGNVETDDSAAVAVALANNPDGANLGGTLSVMANNGVATFAGLTLDQVGSGSTLAVSSNGLSAATSSSISVIPVPAQLLVITQQPPASIVAGASFGLMVQSEDSAGDLASSFNGMVTVALANSATGATLGGMLSVTANQGVATFSGLTLTKAASGYTLVVSSSGVTSATTIAIAITPALASQLVIGTQPSATATAGKAFGVRPVTDEEDQYGNVETGDNSTVITAALASGAGPLQGNTTITVKGGLATFTNLSDDKAETLSLQFTSDGLTSVPTSTIVVSPAATSQLLISQQPSASATAGEPFATQPVVVEEDAYGNIETGDTTTVVTAALSEGAGPLRGTTTAKVVGGVATFTNLADDKAETITLKFAAGAVTSSPTSPIVISPAAASQLVIHTQPSATATAGQPLASQPVVYEEDPHGNLDTGDNSTVITATIASGAGPLQGETTAIVVDGVAAFTNLSDNKAETLSLQFTGGGWSSPASSSIVVSPAAATQLVISQQPSAIAVAGQSLAIQPVIDEEDHFGNLETGDSTTVITAVVSSGAGPLQGTTTAKLVDGVASFTNLADNTAETITLTFTGGGLTSSPASAIAISPAAASQLVIFTQPSAMATAGQPLLSQPVVYEEDQYGNLETADNQSVITAVLSSGTGPIQGTTAVTVSGGIASFTNLADNKAETLEVEFTGSGLTSAAATNPIIVSPAAPSQLVLQTQPSASALVEQPFPIQPVVYVEDPFGNLETGVSGMVITAGLNSGAGPLLGATTATVSAGVAGFTNLADGAAETITLKFSSGTLTPAISNPVIVNPAVDLEISSFTASPQPVELGTDLTYRVVVTNRGPSPATDVTFTSPLSAGVSFVSGSRIVSLQGTNVVANLGTLAAGRSAKVTFIVTPGLIGTLTTSASVTSTETDTDPSNNSATVSTTVLDHIGKIEFSSTGFTVPENAGSATITVNRVNGARGTVMVDYATVPINATPGVDYTPVSGTLTFPPGVTSETIVVPILVDPYDHHDELVSVVLVNVRSSETLGYPILGTPSTATITIKDINPNFSPMVVGNVQWTGTAQAITQIFVTFSRPLTTATATNPANFALVDLGPYGKYGTRHDSNVALSVAMYQSSTSIVALTPSEPLPANRFFHLWINGSASGGLEDIGGNMLAGDGIAAGSSYTAMLAQGTSLRYYTSAGDQVNLKISGGGILDDLLSGSSQGEWLSVVGEVPGHTILAGSVRKLRTGSGRADLGDTISGLGNFGDVRVKLPSPPFRVGQSPFSAASVAAKAVQPVIALSKPGVKPSPVQAAAIRTLNRPFRAFRR